MRGLGRLVVGILVAAAVGAAAVAAVVAPRAQAIRRETALNMLAGLSVDHALDPSGFAAVAPQGEDFGVDSAGVVFLPTSSGLAAVRRLGEGAARGPGRVAPSSLAVGQDDTMLTVSRGYLGRLGEAGDPIQAVPLPSDRLRLAPSSAAGVTYLFGPEPDGPGHRAYAFYESGAFTLLAYSDEPFVGAADREGAVFLATTRQVARITPQGPQIVFTAPDDPDFGPILSVAAAQDGLVFLSTPRRVYAVRGGVALSIVNDSGGSLRWRDSRLWVLDRTRRLLYALSPADRSMFGEAAT